MKLSRVLSSGAAVTALVLVAACGGGGGSVTPPGGGGGGGPHPTNSPTPSPVPTQAANWPTGATLATSSQMVSAEENFVNGDYSWYKSGTASWSTDAGDTSAGASGKNLDGTSCGLMSEPTSTATYHVHAFVGLYANGVWEAIPQAIGMKNPTEPKASGEPNDTYNVETASCFYQMHTHDYSGLIHIEDPSKFQDLTWKTIQPYATLQTLFDLWGESVTPMSLATFNGPVTIYTGKASTTDGHGNDVVNAYTPSAAGPSGITLRHHEAVWIVVGTPPAAGLPQVKFVIEN